MTQLTEKEAMKKVNAGVSSDNLAAIAPKILYIEDLQVEKEGKASVCFYNQPANNLRLYLPVTHGSTDAGGAEVTTAKMEFEYGVRSQDNEYAQGGYAHVLSHIKKHVDEQRQGSFQPMQFIMPLAEKREGRKVGHFTAMLINANGKGQYQVTILDSKPKPGFFEKIYHKVLWHTHPTADQHLTHMIGQALIGDNSSESMNVTELAPPHSGDFFTWKKYFTQQYDGKPERISVGAFLIRVLMVIIPIMPIVRLIERIKRPSPNKRYSVNSTDGVVSLERRYYGHQSRFHDNTCSAFTLKVLDSSLNYTTPVEGTVFDGFTIPKPNSFFGSSDSYLDNDFLRKVGVAVSDIALPGGRATIPSGAFGGPNSQWGHDDLSNDDASELNTENEPDESPGNRPT